MIFSNIIPIFAEQKLTKMNWKELKDFCNSLDEEQLEKKVILWREDEAINDITAGELEADYYIGEDDEGCYSLSDAGIDISEVEDLELKKVYDKGNPLLYENF